MTIPGWVPRTREQLACVGGLLVGGLLGWVSHPLVWIVAGPFRWWALLLGIAAQESSFSREAQGAAGEVGALQFTSSTWNALGGGDRTSSLLSSYRAAQYVQGALITDLRWLGIAVPVLGFALVRYLWTNGPSSAAEAWSGGAWSKSTGESNSWPAFLVARTLTIWPLLLLAVYLWKRRDRL